MKKIVKTLTAAMCAATILFPAKTFAQNEFSVSGKADFVSDYIWRGADQNSGFSVQPSLTLGYKGFALNLWGSQTLSRWNTETPAKEFDINLSYSYKGFTVMVSDLWWAGVNQPYGYYKNSHWFEGTLSYNFGERVPLTLSWSTVFAGKADLNSDGNQNFSSYFNASYNVSLPYDVTLTPSIGFLPWGAVYHGVDKFALTDISLKASKDIKITDSFSIPLFVQGIVSPEFDRTYLVAGFSLGF